jgi:hypothetical protein
MSQAESPESRKPFRHFRALTQRGSACAKPKIFPVSHFEICSYSEKAQRFLATTDLN